MLLLLLLLLFLQSNHSNLPTRELTSDAEWTLLILADSLFSLSSGSSTVSSLDIKAFVQGTLEMLFHMEGDDSGKERGALLNCNSYKQTDKQMEN